LFDIPIEISTVRDIVIKLINHRGAAPGAVGDQHTARRAARRGARPQCGADPAGGRGALTRVASAGGLEAGAAPGGGAEAGGRRSGAPRAAHTRRGARRSKGGSGGGRRIRE
jgi:hypothetical protein